MKKQEFKKLREESILSLKKSLSKEQEEKVRAQMELKTGQLKNVKKVRALRKEIAQILTLIREKELKGEK